MDTLTVRDNSVHVRYMEAGWENSTEKESLYPENTFLCEVSTDLEASAKSLTIEILYEEELLTLEQCMPLASGLTADTSTPGRIRLTASQTIGSGEQTLCYLFFSAKEAVKGSAHVAVSPESTLTNYDGTFLFVECTGLLMEVCLPDYNGDSITDLRDFALLAKQHGA